jgi:hypothetical protein
MRPRRLAVGWALAAVTALLAVGCGDPGDGGTGPGSTAPSSTTVIGETTEVTLFLTKGERLEPATRAVPKVTRIGGETVKALLAGPTAEESAAGLGTAIPAGTRFIDLNIADGVARVDLSREFESGGGTLSLTMRLAQVACTLDQFDTVDGVRFLLDGTLVDVFSGDGIVVDRPMGCADFPELQPVGSAVLFDGIWPFSSTAEVDAYVARGDTAYSDPVATAAAFAERYVGMAGPVTFGPATSDGALREVKVGFGTGEGGAPVADPRPTMSVFLRDADGGDNGPWTAVRADAADIVVDKPAAKDRISSPAQLRGSALAFEGNVNVEVREDGMVAGQFLGEGFVTGGGGPAAPFAGTIAFTKPTKPGGAVVFFDRSSADGQGVLRATVVRVAF